MEDKKTLRTLSEEELEKVSGGYNRQECFNKCKPLGLIPHNENGECKCVNSLGDCVLKGVQ